jgi:hypothetical protein
VSGDGGDELDDAVLRKQVNDTGFPLQLAVEHEVRTTSAQWKIVARELYWSQNSRSGYADLVIFRDPIFFVIECKRRSAGHWAFLTDKELLRSSLRAVVADREGLFISDYGTFDPSTPQADFCAVAGAKNDDRRSLERIASELVVATEAIAGMHAERAKVTQGLEPCVFIPMIVTVPTPAFISVSPEMISIEDGTIPSGASFEPARFVRFRKPLAQLGDEIPISAASLEDIAENTERTVMVVHAPHLASFLDGLWSVKRENMYSLTRRGRS